MHILRKRLFIMMMLLLMVFNLPMPVNAEEDTKKADKNQDGYIASKDEVVYATLHPSGDQKEMYVVNMLEVTKAGKVVDYGHYESVKNLTDLTDIKQSEDTITVEAPEGKFYYQGNMTDTPLPWHFTITYYLDNEQVEAQELIGKTGHVQMDIDVKQHKKADKAFFENYILQLSLPFDADTTKNIKAEEAVVASAGKDELVTFTAMPDEEATFTAEADVEDFEMDAIEISGVPSTMSIDAPDTDDMTGDIQTLADAIAEVNGGVADLKQGVAELNKGTSDLEDGSSEFKSGLTELDGSSAELVDGSSEINQALQTLDSSLGELDNINLEEFNELQAGISEMSSGFKEAKDGLSALQDSYSDAYGALEKAIDDIPSEQLSESDIKELYESGADRETIDQLVATYEAAQIAKGTFNEVKQGFEAVDTTLGTVIESLGEAEAGVDQVVDELGASLDEMDMGEGMEALQEGVNDLATNYEEFHGGLVAYTNGVSELTNAYQELDGGISDLSSGTDDIETGVGELHNGTNQLERSTSNLPAEMTEEIDQMIDEYDKSNFDAISFVEPDKNEEVFAVQFVLQTESLKKEEQETEDDEQEEEKGVWERFLDLFR